MKTIATFTKPEQAHLLRMRLESAGIAAFLQDEQMVQMDILFSNCIGGVRVQVANEDAEVAREFLAADAGLAEAPATEGTHCPKCNSGAVELEHFSKRLAYVSLAFIGVPLLFFRKRLRCENCLHTWKA